jgi:integrase
MGGDPTHPGASPSWPAGLRDRTLLLVGFFAALRRAELAALTVEQISTHDRGLVLAVPRSKTNQHRDQAELVVPPQRPRRALPGHRPAGLA